MRFKTTSGLQLKLESGLFLGEVRLRESPVRPVLGVGFGGVKVSCLVVCMRLGSRVERPLLSCLFWKN